MILSNKALVAALLMAPAAADITLVAFDGTAGAVSDFTEMNDPVMGGQSTGTWEITADGTYGIFDGEVKDVPSLSAPGFIKAAADGSFNDASAAIDGALTLTLRSTTPEYKGFRVAFASGTSSPDYACAGGGGIPFSRGCFKSPAFDAPAGDEFTTVSIPFNMFSDKWSSATGEQTTTCADDTDVCPTADKLAKIQRVEVWAEGADGAVHLELLSVVATTATAAKATAGADVTLVSFSGADGAVSDFTELNDPVMGGQSTGTWDVKETYGVFDGEVKDVPSLSAPGFIKAAADGSFNDASAAIDGDLVLTVRSSTPEYTGFRVSFASGTTSPSYACSGGGGLPFSRGCFKAQFDVPAGDAFVEVKVPFNMFSDKWSSATGEQTTTCADDADVCPTADKLAKIQRVEVWAEGVDGAIHLEISDIRAVSATARAAPATPSVELVPDEYMTCTGAVQDDLRYNMSSRTQAYGLAVPVDDGESLAEAVCCDSRVKPYAEPQYTYFAPDIMMYEHLDESGVTTFYDSVCGLPLFMAPMNRTLDEFKADTDEHGWPSFRPNEVVDENVVTDEETGYVTSACGTHLGSFLPDAEGDRWCIDLSCVSGNPVAKH